MDEETSQHPWDWGHVEDRVRALPDTRGFGPRVEFMSFRVAETGAVSRRRAGRGTAWEPVRDARVVEEIYRLLYYYAGGPDHAVPRDEEVLTKVSQLAAHFRACSTNQHLIEETFRQLVDRDVTRGTKQLEHLLARVFHAEAADHGDRAWRVPLLPYLPVWLVYYEAEGAEGLPSDLKILFERHATEYLPQTLCEGLERLFLDEVQRLA